MRVTSELFVSALVRRVFSSGGFAAIERKGASEAGAIFIRQRFRAGSERLYGPAPQTAFGEDGADDRRFEIRLETTDLSQIETLITREARFDADLWLVELEIDDIGDLFAVVS